MVLLSDLFPSQCFFHGNNTHTSVYHKIQQLFLTDCHLKQEIKVGQS